MTPTLTVRRARAGSGWRTIVLLDPAPLITAAGHPRNHHAATARRLGVSREQVTRWANRRQNITPLQADRCAVRLGHHPADIWGQAWWDIP